jgi:Domain of unknown function (DUF4365)
VAARKTVTQQTIIGEQGIALIGTRCLEMGFIFHPRRVDHGIDGHIDLVEPGSGNRAILNQTLLVQSKAQNRPFAFETDDSFRYICDERDLDLWLSGNAPVILIFSHPEQGDAWWVDVKAAFPDVVSRASRTVVVDKRTRRFDKDAAPALLELAVPGSSGLYLRPAPKTETLTTNLLPITAMPPVVYLATSAVRDYPAAGEALATQAERRPGWILREGVIMSFASLREPPLSVLCDGDVEEHETSEWADSDDLDMQYRFMDLLRHTVTDSYADLRWHKERSHVHFRATPDLKARKAGRGPGVLGRTVFGPHYAKSEPEKVSYYHHAALQLRFRRFDGRWYCQLEPDYCFTSDGYAESRLADKLLAGIKRLDRHPAVAGWTRAWTNHFRAEGGSERLIGFGPLATVTVDRGIDDRWWGPAPVELTPDEEPDQAEAEEAVATALLSEADIDTEDLAAIVTGPDANSPAPARPPRRKRQPCSQRQPGRSTKRGSHAG